MGGEQGISRRMALGGGAALVAALGVRGIAAAQKGVQSGGGIAGGGSIDTDEGGTATFSVFGSQFAIDGVAEPVFFGSLTWNDTNGTALAGTAISAYGPVAGAEETTREMHGTLAVNGAGSHPFTIVLADGGAPGEGKDTVRLIVGPDGAAATPAAGDAVYQAEATLTNGDLQLLTFTFPE
jgi:hypothetical protein